MASPKRHRGSRSVLVCPHCAKEITITIAPLQRAQIDWSTVDWSKSGAELSRSLGVDQIYLAHRRREYAPLTRKKRPLIDWKKIDFGRPTSVIAKEIGCSRESVSIARRKHAPQTIGKFAVPRSRQPIEWARVNFARPTSELAKELDVSGAAVAAARRKYAPKTVGQFYPKRVNVNHVGETDYGK